MNQAFKIVCAICIYSALCLGQSGIVHGASTLQFKLAGVAGENAVKCGHVGTEEDPTSANECAEKNFTQKRPFYLSYELPHSDSDYEYGLAMNNKGRMYLVEYDSMGFQLDRRFKDVALSDNSHIATRSCPRPNRLQKDKSTNRLTCFALPQH